MKILTFDDIVGLGITPLQCLTWVEEALRVKGEAVLPAKISVKPGIPGVFYNVMPCVIGTLGVAGVKVVTRYPDASPTLNAAILTYPLSGPSAGIPDALVDGTWITAMRTGAVAAHSIALFANPGFAQVGVIGLGNTARATVAVMAQQYPDRQIHFRLLSHKGQEELFKARFAHVSNFTFEVCDTEQEVIDGADVVLSAVTVFEEDIADPSWFKPGALLVPIHTRGFTGCDLVFDKVFADDTGHVQGFKYFDQFRQFAEVSEVVAGTHPGRTSPEERIIAYNIGIALHDVYFATQINRLAGGAEAIDLGQPSPRFWV